MADRPGSDLFGLPAGALRGFAALAIAGVAVPVALAQVPAPPALSERRISDDARPQTFETDRTPDPEPDLSDEATSEELQRSLKSEQEFEEPESAAEPVEPEAQAAEPVEVRDFDLFSGPRQTRVVRANLPGAARARARATNRNAEPETVDERETGSVERAGPSTRDPMDPIGPVRSPALSVQDAAGRLNTAATGFRRSLPVVEDDPYAPSGVRAGRFILYPTLEQSVGVSDNLSRSAEGVGGAFTETTLSGRAVSDWSQHEAEINATASYRRNFEGSPPEEPQLDLDGRLRLHVGRDWTATLRGAVAYSRESAFSADPLTPADERPDVLAYSGGADLERSVGRARLTLSGQIVREEREPVGGGASADDFSTYSAGLRASYDLAPAFQPFVSASIGRRVFDEGLDALGRDRHSVIPALRLGVGFDRGEKLYGEVALGYAVNVPDADALETQGSPTLDARINWSPRRGTDVLLTAATYFDPDRTNLSTSTIYEATLGIRHRATARLDLTALVGAAYRDQSLYSDEATYALEAGLTYWLNRSLALTTLARHERLTSDTGASEYDATSVQVGLRVQR